MAGPGGRPRATSRRGPGRTCRACPVELDDARRRPGRRPGCGRARTAGSTRRRPARPPGRRAPAASAGQASLDGVGRRSQLTPRRVSRTTRTPAHTIAVSARLKIGQCGNSRKSTTWPRATPGARNSRSERFPHAPPSSRPKATAQQPAAESARSPDDEDHDRDGDQGQHPGHAGGRRERRPGVAGQVEAQHRTEEAGRLPLGEVGDGERLGDLIEHEDGKRYTGDEREQTARWPIRCGWLSVRGPGGVDGFGDQRRSWRCLSATHRVARGKACRRSFPIGLPQTSHRP